MILYIEKSVLDHPRTARMRAAFPDAEILPIDHYKNLADRDFGNMPIENCLILAQIAGTHVSPCPPDYDPYDHSFFFKPAVGCVFDCAYCYLKGAFVNSIPVLFVNFEDMEADMLRTVQKVREVDPTGSILFYASDYSDMLALEYLTGFHEYFVRLFETLPNVHLETRTKSTNVAPILRAFETDVPKNTEFAFSLNPESIIRRYERKTPPLQARLNAINTLVEKGFRVGLRIIPLLPIDNAVEAYREFLGILQTSVDLSKIASVSFGTIVYTKEDLKRLQFREPDFDLLYRFE